MKIYLVGYIKKKFRPVHTNFWPWSYLNTTFKNLGYHSEHVPIRKLNSSEPAIYVCWNDPDSIELIEQLRPHPDSVVIQKLTSFDSSVESNRDWTLEPREFFKSWNWPQYQKLENLASSGYRYFGFGAKSDLEYSPIKQNLVLKHQKRLFFIPWGSMIVPFEEILVAKPRLNNFKYDVGFVGSRWGTRERGNIQDWEQFLDPIITPNSFIGGKGTIRGIVGIDEHLRILRSSKLCPIIHANGWKAERGIMDRFWTVFSLGRFGVVDNEGILDFYNEDEVVLATEPEEYIDKSLYFMKNPEKQKPYIEAALARIKTEYNQHVVWKKILSQILSE